jgi:hypothetical protein
MTSVVGWELFTVVVLLGSGDGFGCGNFDRRRAVGSGAGFFPSLVSIRLEGPMFTCVEGPKLIVAYWIN